MARIHRRYTKKKKNPSSSPSRNPTAVRDLVEFVGPGFAAFAVTRFGTRITTQVVAKYKPSLGKHAGALTSVGAFVAAWLLAHRVKFLHKYHTPIVVGAAIAALQSLIQIYIPRIGWMVADASPELAAATAPAQTPADVTVLEGEDPEAYVYDDRYDPGVHGTQTQHQQYQPPSQPSQPQSSSVSGDDLMDLEMETEEAQTMGIFGGQN